MTDLLSFGESGGIDLTKSEQSDLSEQVRAVTRDYHVEPRLGLYFLTFFFFKYLFLF